jgi:hypothetical protein
MNFLLFSGLFIRIDQGKSGWVNWDEQLTQKERKN